MTKKQPEAEPHVGAINSRLNWLRAGVLGANDGIVSTAGLVIGVAGASPERSAVALAGVAGLVAGALSMATGEYVSVSSQRDTEQVLLDKERRELRDFPDEELAELAQLYQAKGLTPELAQAVAEQLTEHDAFAAHVDIELGIDPDELTNPWHAAWASAGSFAIGACLPLLAIAFCPNSIRVPVTFLAVVFALILTGWGSARLGGAGVQRAIIRNVGGGMIAMCITYLVGWLIGRYS